MREEESQGQRLGAKVAMKAGGFLATAMGLGDVSICHLVEPFCKSRLLLRQRPLVVSSGTSSQLAIASPTVTNVISRCLNKVQSIARLLIALQTITAVRI